MKSQDLINTREVQLFGLIWAITHRRIYDNLFSIKKEFVDDVKDDVLVNKLYQNIKKRLDRLPSMKFVHGIILYCK